MAEILTIARPYAEAVFDLAKQSSKVDHWSAALAALAQVAQHPDVAMIIGNPRYSTEQVKSVLFACADKTITQDVEVQSFVNTLVENHRLSLLPEIAAQYAVLKAEDAGIQYAKIFTAIPLTPAQQQDVVQMLEKKYACKVRVKEILDADLIAGVKIIIGDDVIDASARGKLQAMAYSLTS